MKKSVFVLVLVLTLLVQVSLNYKGIYLPPSFERPDFEKVGVVKAPAEEFLDEYVSTEGTVIFDMAHDNGIELQELNVLVSRLIARGYKVEYMENADDLENSLKYADAFVVISPVVTYSGEQIDLLSRFVEKNGKLLLIHDPTRKDSMNTLAVGFGVTFDSGYLYNQLENDGNFQYIFLEDFELNDLTKGLDKVSMYVASSITSTGRGLAHTDENTFSSTQTKQRFSPMVLTSSGNALAIGDISFMLEPYNSVFDNNKLVSNIADFLTTGGRLYHLTDHPHYLDDGYFLVYGEDSLLDDALEIKKLIGKRTALRSDDPGYGDTLIVNTFNSTLAQKYLDQAGIVVNDTLEVKGVGELQKEGSLVITLTQRAGRRVLTLAADDETGLEEAISKLEELDEISITDFVAYFTYEPDTEEESSETPSPEENQTHVEGEQIETLNLTNETTSYMGRVIIIQPR